MKIVIIGGSIGGLSTAVALKQIGFDVEIYERDNQTSDIGAGIVCWPNASFVLDKLTYVRTLFKNHNIFFQKGWYLKSHYEY